MKPFPDQLLIEGEWRPACSGKKMIQVNPATEEILTEVSAAGPQDVIEAAKGAQRVFQETWRHYDRGKRAELLERIAQSLRENREKLARLETLNCGKPIMGTRQGVERGAEAFESAAKQIGEFEERRISDPGPGVEVQYRNPLGMTGVIAPWNDAIAWACLEAAPALAAGNCVILKPSSRSALAPLLLGGIFLEAGLPAGVLQVLPGLGREVAEPLAAHPLVRRISFAGSSQAGARIMELAARSLKRISLNIGKPSGLVVFENSDWERVAARCAEGVFFNTGQDPSAHLRVWIEKSICEPFLERFLVSAKKLRVGDPFDEETQLGPLISGKERQRIEQVLQEARAAGRKIALGGERLSGRGFFLKPAVLPGVELKDRVWREEIFGPIACVRSFEDERGLLRECSGWSTGMNFSIFMNDPERGFKLVRELENGTIRMNPELDGDRMRMAPGGFMSGGTEFGTGMAERFTEIKRVI